MPGIIKGRTTFAEFFPWAQEIVSFIEQLDLEDVHDSQLMAVEKSAAIGYEIPPAVNDILKNIVKIRRAYHDYFKKQQRYPRGMRYQAAAQNAAGADLSAFDAVIFAGFFYLHKSEQKVLKIFLPLTR